MGFLDFFKKEYNTVLRPVTCAIIVAAGNGSRMGEEFPNKQLIEINGTPVLARTLSAFEGADTIDEIVIVTREELILPIADISKSMCFKKVSCVVKGAETRQLSVMEGLKVVNENTEFVSIHDGARPFVTSKEIDMCNNAAYQHSCAALGVRVKDTIKTVDNGGFIVKTVDRSTLWMVNTPQSFNFAIYKAALSMAQNQGKDFTDDCQIIENASGKVYLVEGSYDNIKITTPEDLLVGESIARTREVF